MKITKRIELDAGHRVPDHGSQCRNPHGHRYTVEIEVTGPVQTVAGTVENGMVVDYGRLKTLLMTEVHARWDHAFLVYQGDDALVAFLADHDYRTDVLDRVPTAENLAVLVADRLTKPVEALHPDVTLRRVTVWETPTCSATWEAS